MDNRFNEVFPAFDSLNPEFTSGCRVIDSFSGCFSFHSFNRQNKESLSSYFHQLNSLALSLLENPSHALIITDTSVKNNVATSIAHVHIHNKPVVKTLHYVVNINSTEAKLFTIKYGIFDSASHPFQIHTLSILCELFHEL